MSYKPRRDFSRFAGITAVAALGVLALVLIGLALRPPQVLNAGDMPSRPVPTWGVATPTAPSIDLPTAVSPKASPKYSLVMLDSLIGLRARSESCLLNIPATVERTTDAGVTWSPVSLGVAEPLQILSMTADSPDQISLVIRQGADCAPLLVRSFTDGEFWQSYPGLLAEITYFDISVPGTIFNLGTEIPAPCPAPNDVVTIPTGVIAACEDGTYAYSSEFQSWSAISAPSDALAYDSQLNIIFQGVTSSDACAGVEVRQVILSDESTVANGLACVSTDDLASGVALSAVANSLILWVGSEIFKSSDSGLNWSELGGL